MHAPTRYCSSDIKIDISLIITPIFYHRKKVASPIQIIVLVLNEVILAIRFKWSVITYSFRMKWYHLFVLNEVLSPIRFEWSDITYSFRMKLYHVFVSNASSSDQYFWANLYQIRRWCNIVQWCDRAMAMMSVNIWSIYRVILIPLSHHRADRFICIRAIFRKIMSGRD